MKKFKVLFAVMIAMALVTAFTISASAQEKLLDTTIEQMVVAKDKNGNDYVRFIIKEDRELNGVAYQMEVVTMVFGAEKVQQAQANYSPGDQLKAIASVNEYQGRTNYNIIQFLN